MEQSKLKKSNKKLIKKVELKKSWIKITVGLIQDFFNYMTHMTISFVDTLI